MGAGAAAVAGAQGGVAPAGVAHFDKEAKWLVDAFVKEKSEKDWIRQRYERVETDLVEKEDEIQRLRAELDALRMHCATAPAAGSHPDSRPCSRPASPSDADSNAGGLRFARTSSLGARRGMSIAGLSIDARLPSAAAAGKTLPGPELLVKATDAGDGNAALHSNSGNCGVLREPMSPLLARRRSMQAQARMAEAGTLAANPMVVRAAQRFLAAGKAANAGTPASPKLPPKNLFESFG